MFTRILAVCAASMGTLAIANPGLIGSWNGQIEGKAVALTVDSKGGGNIDGVPMRYQTVGSALFVERHGQVIAYQFELRGGQLLVAGGDLPGVLVMNKGTKPAAAAPVPGRAAPQTQQGGIQPELIGKWCLVKNFSANAGGGSSSSTCFELRANGTYVYASERSMSAYGGGMWGGTSSNSGDAGRWSATAGSITAMSNNGRTTTYRLEKRNHPKNSDPMLCLDGDCYVTYWNKPRW